MLPIVCRRLYLGDLESRSHISTIALGKALAAAKRQLVYGGGSKGIMGIVSGAVLSAGGDVVGVIPRALLDTKEENERVAGDNSAPLLIELKDGRERVCVVRLRGTLTESVLRWNVYGRSRTVVAFSDIDPRSS